MSYSMPDKGGGNDTFNSVLYMTARLSPTLQSTWTSNYDTQIGEDAYSFDNAFRLLWRPSQYLFINTGLTFTYNSGQDLVSQFNVSTGLTPNRKHRLNFGYSISDQDDITQTVTTSWRWLITPVFNFRLGANYRFAEEDSWIVSGVLSAYYSNL
jgi:hypothetical protein